MKRIVKNNNTCADICDDHVGLPLWPSDDDSMGLIGHARRTGNLRTYEYEGSTFWIVDRAAWVSYPYRDKLHGDKGVAKLRVRKQLREVYVLRSSRWAPSCEDER